MMASSPPSVQTVPTKAPTTPAPTATPKPTLTPTFQPMPPLEVGSVQAYHNAEGGFSLLLPAGWAMSPTRQTPLGSAYELGPAPLFEGRPGNGRLVVADSAQISMEKAVELLCDSGCTRMPELMEAVLGGSEAKLAIVERPEQPTLEWHFVKHGGTLAYFSIHHPDTLEPLDGVIQTFSFDPAPTGMAATTCVAGNGGVRSSGPEVKLTLLLGNALARPFYTQLHPPLGLRGDEGVLDSISTATFG